jgi:hypothetical protein
MRKEFGMRGKKRRIEGLFYCGHIDGGIVAAEMISVDGHGKGGNRHEKKQLSMSIHGSIDGSIRGFRAVWR